MAFAADKFVSSLLQALAGEDGVVECAYVASEEADTKYFSTPLLLGVSCLRGNDANFDVGIDRRLDLKMIGFIRNELKLRLALTHFEFNSMICDWNNWIFIFFYRQRNGVEKNLGLGKLNDYEVTLVKNAMPELQKNIKKGEEFLAKNPIKD